MRYNSKSVSPVEPMRGIADALERQEPEARERPARVRSRYTAQDFGAMQRDREQGMSCEAIAQKYGCSPSHVSKRLRRARERATKSQCEQIREYAAQHPGISPETLARRLDQPREMVDRALSGRDQESWARRQANRKKPPSLRALCAHDRARNLRQHRSHELRPCCLKGPPTMYLAVVLTLHESKVLGLCPPLDLVVTAESLDQLAARLRAAVDAALDIALSQGYFVQMPCPVESPRPSEIWSIAIPQEQARRLYHRWRAEPWGAIPVAEQQVADSS